MCIKDQACVVLVAGAVPRAKNKHLLQKLGCGGTLNMGICCHGSKVEMEFLQGFPTVRISQVPSCVHRGAGWRRSGAHAGYRNSNIGKYIDQCSKRPAARGVPRRNGSLYGEGQQASARRWRSAVLAT